MEPLMYGWVVVQGLHITSLKEDGSLVLAMKSDMALRDCRSI